MDKRKHWKKIGELSDDLIGHEKTILSLAMDVDDNYTAKEARETGGLIFALWEEVAHFKDTLRKLEKLQEQEYKEMLKDHVVEGE